MEYAAATAAAESGIYSTTAGAGGVICPIFVCCCCNLRFDRHVDKKSLSCVLYRRVVRCGAIGGGSVVVTDVGELLGGIIN